MDNQPEMAQQPSEGPFVFLPPPEAPVFEPTWSEFSDSLAFINKIRPTLEKTGICKIKPPAGWQPPFAIDVDEFKFVPRVQKINELEARTRVKINFLNKLWRFWNFQGVTLKVPTVGRKQLDFHKLHKAVQSEGGFEEVTQKGKWQLISQKYMNLKEVMNKNYAAVLYGHYEKFLYPFDVFEAGVFNANQSDRVSAKSPLKSESPPSSSSDENVKSEPVDYKLNTELKRLQYHGAGRKAVMPSQQRTKTGKTMASVKADEEEKAEPRTLRDRSALLRQACATASTNQCKQCGRYDYSDSMLACTQCERVFHRTCLLTPVTSEIIGEWRCPQCLAKECDKHNDVFGFPQSSTEYSLSKFGEMADQFKEKYFGKAVHEVECHEVEHEFWRLSTCLNENVQVQYGADIHALTNGSGFPTELTDDISDDDEKYIDSEWNLNVMPVLPKSILQYITGDVSGMKVPWCYVGMCFSSFCWHIEDHWSYSINFMHWGEPKTWYGVPATHAEQLESVMKSLAPELFKASPDLLHHITTQLNPNVLMKHGIPVVRTNQCAGEFVITAPRSYHAGFNQGYNFAEAVNFCPADWLPMGRLCISAYKDVCRPCVFSHEELICKLASDYENLEMEIAISTHSELVVICETERTGRKLLQDKGTCRAERVKYELLPDDSRTCYICKTTIFMSGLSCTCNPGRTVCLSDHDRLCPCEYKNKTLKYRFTLDELPGLLAALNSKINGYQNWCKRVETALQSADAQHRISFSDLKKLLHEYREKKFPDGNLPKKLQHVIREADKCACQAKELTHRRARSKRHTDLAIKSAARRVSVEELRLFINDLAKIPCKIDETDQLEELLSKAQNFQTTVTSYLKKESDWSVEELLKLFNEGVDLDFELPEISQLEQSLSQTQWIQQADDVMGEEEPLMEDIEKLHESGLKLIQTQQVKITLQEISDLLKSCEMWQHRALTCLDANPPCSVNSLEEIIDGASEVNAYLPNIEALKDSLKKCDEWNKKARLLLNTDDLPYKVLDVHLQKGRLIPVKLEQQAHLSALMRMVEDWCSEAESRFLLPDRDWKLVDVLLPRLESTCSPFTAPRRRKRRNGPAETITQSDRHDEIMNRLREAEEREVDFMSALRLDNRKRENNFSCCICNINPTDAMYQCSLCYVWIHYSCFGGGINSNELCTECLRSKHPNLDEIKRLLIDLKSIPVQFDEGEALQCMTERVIQYQNKSTSFCSQLEVKNLINKFNQLSANRGGELIEISEHQADHCYTKLTDDADYSRIEPSDWILTQLDKLSFEGLLLEVNIDETTTLLKLYQQCIEYNQLKLKQLQEAAKPKPVKRSPTVKRQRPETTRKKRQKKENTSSEQDEWGDYDEQCAAPNKCQLPDDESIGWVQCAPCERWFHFICVSLDPSQLNEDEDYTCDICVREQQESIPTKIDQSQYGSDADSCSSHDPDLIINQSESPNSSSTNVSQSQPSINAIVQSRLTSCS